MGFGLTSEKAVAVADDDVQGSDTEVGGGVQWSLASLPRRSNGAVGYGVGRHSYVFLNAGYIFFQTFPVVVGFVTNGSVVAQGSGHD